MQLCQCGQTRCWEGGTLDFGNLAALKSLVLARFTDQAGVWVTLHAETAVDALGCRAHQPLLGARAGLRGLHRARNGCTRMPVICTNLLVVEGIHGARNATQARIGGPVSYTHLTLPTTPYV